MSRIPGFLTAFILALLAGKAGAAIQNGDFESSPDLTGWTVGGSGASIETANPLAGSKSLKMVRATSSLVSQSLSPAITTGPATLSFNFKVSGSASTTGDRTFNLSVAGSTGFINLRVTGAGAVEVFGTANGGAGTGTWQATGITGLAFDTPYSMTVLFDSFGSGATYDISVGASTADNLNIFQTAPLASLSQVRFASSASYSTSSFLVDNVVVADSVSASPFRLTFAPNAGTPDHYDFSWNSQSGKLYDLVSSTDLATTPATWAVWDPDGEGGTPPYGDIDPFGTGTNTLTDVPGGGDPRRFFAVIGKDPPPPPDPVVVANLGVSGQNSSEGLASFASKLSPLPDHVVIYYGMNDALNSSKLVSLATFTSNLTSMVNQALNAGVTNVFLVGIHPINEEYLAERHPTHPEVDRLQDHLAEYDAAVAQVAANTAATFIDWRPRFLAESPGTTIAEATANSVDCLLRCEANSPDRDGLHLTATGNHFLGDEVLGAIQSVVSPGDRIHCIGDSVTYGVHVTGEGTATGDTYPAVLAAGLNP